MRGCRRGRLRSIYRGKNKTRRAEYFLLVEEYLNSEVKKYIKEKFHFEVEFSL